MARHPLVKINFGFSRWPYGRRSTGPPGGRSAPDEGIADEARHDGHRVLGEAILQVRPVPETFQPPCRTVVPQRPRRASQVTLDDAPGPPVQLRTPRPQPMEDGSGRILVL